MRISLNVRIRKTTARTPRTLVAVSATSISLLVFSSVTFAQQCPAGAAPLELGLCEHRLGLAEYAIGNTERAENHYLRAMSAFEQTSEQTAAQQVTTLIGLGRLYQATSRYPEATRSLTRALELSRHLTAEPTLAAVALSRLGGVYSVSGSVDQARAMLTEGIEKLEALPIPDRPELAYAYYSLGMAELRVGAYSAGESDIRQAVSIATASLGESDSQTAIYESALGLALYLEGRYSRALPVLRRAEFLLEAHPAENSFHLGTALAEISAVEVALGKLTLAENDGSRALSVLKLRQAPDSAEVVKAQVNLAAIYLVEHKTAEAATILPDAVAAERQLMTDSLALANGVRWLAQLRAQQHDWTEADALYREAIRLYSARPGAVHPEIVPVKHEYAKVLRAAHAKSPSPSATPAT